MTLMSPKVVFFNRLDISSHECLYVCVVGEVVSDSAFASISLENAKSDTRFLGDNLGLHDTPAAKTRCIVKLSYRNEAGEAYASVATQLCKWTVAVFNLERIPDAMEIDETAKSVIAFGGWPLDTPVEN